MQLVTPPPFETLNQPLWSKVCAATGRLFKAITGRYITSSITFEQFKTAYLEERFDEALGNAEDDLELYQLYIECLDHLSQQELGRLLVNSAPLTWVKKRQALIRTLREHPETLNIPIRKPIFIMGLHRTGSTFLHRLLALDPATRGTKLFDLSTPSSHPAPTRDEYFNNAGSVAASTEKDYAQFEKFFGDMSIVYRNHYSSASTQEEMYLKTVECGFLAPGYVLPCVNRPDLRQRVLDHTFRKDNKANTARYIRRFLQYLASGYNPESHFVLKDPQGIFYAEALVEEFPDISVVFTHRDPYETSASFARLFYDISALCMYDFKHVTPEYIGKFTTDVMLEMQRRIVQYAEREERGEVPRAAHVDFRNFMTDPIATVEKLYAQFGYVVSDEFRANMRAYLDDNPRYKHGKVVTSHEMFEIDPDAVVLPEYVDRFLGGKTKANLSDKKTDGLDDEEVLEK